MVTIIFLFGLIIGSFLSVCIYRIPRSKAYIEYLQEDLEEEESSIIQNDDQNSSNPINDGLNIPITPNSALSIKPLSLVDPLWSMCTYCEIPLKWYNNIPVFSFILQLGRCSCKKNKISYRYPLVEIMTGITALLCYSTYGLNFTSIVLFCFCCALIVITFIDYDFFIIPNVISIPGFLIGVVVAIINEYTHIFDDPFVPGVTYATFGVLAGAGFLWVVATAYLKFRKKDGLGFGDVKLLAMTGVFFGPECAIQTIFIASFLGSVIGLVFIVFGKKEFGQKLPFGPYLAFGTFFYLFIGVDSFINFLQNLL